MVDNYGNEKDEIQVSVVASKIEFVTASTCDTQIERNLMIANEIRHTLFDSPVCVIKLLRAKTEKTDMMITNRILGIAL